jgi:hypothetical protein
MMKLDRDEAEEHFDEETWDFVCDLEEASQTDLEFFHDDKYRIRFDDCDGLFVGEGASLLEAYAELVSQIKGQ